MKIFYDCFVRRSFNATACRMKKPKIWVHKHLLLFYQLTITKYLLPLLSTLCSDWLRAVHWAPIGWEQYTVLWLIESSMCALIGWDHYTVFWLVESITRCSDLLRAEHCVLIGWEQNTVFWLAESITLCSDWLRAEHCVLIGWQQ